MLLSIWTNFYHELSPNDALKKIAASKFRCVELEGLKPFMAFDNPDSALAETKQLAADLGIKLHQLHGYWGAYCAPGSDAWQENLDYFAKEIDFAQKLGIEVIVAHPMQPEHAPQSQADHDKAIDLNIHFYNEIADLLKGTDVSVGVENMPYTFKVFDCADDLIRVVDAVDSPQIGITLDTSHLNMSRGNFSRFIHKVGHRLIATHISDNLKDDDHHLLPMFGRDYQGWIDWTEVRDALREINYQGTFNLEVPGETAAPIPIRDLKLNCAYDTLNWFLNEDNSSS